jgi:hypothetical protein
MIQPQFIRTSGAMPLSSPLLVRRTVGRGSILLLRD